MIVTVDTSVLVSGVFIVSGDSHLTEMDVVQGITVVTLRQFVDRLKLG